MVYQAQNYSFIDHLFGLLNEGGPMFMYVTFLWLIFVIYLFVVGIMKRHLIPKQIKLLKSVSLFALVWGFLGQMVGIIGAFDTIQVHGDIAPSVLAAGIKVSILSPTFGMFVFLVARVGIITLIYREKNDLKDNHS